ncbi:MAG: flagellar basal body P-ring protein FlgI [Bdellovibrionales bacterium]|nr:flagellar basal body P-ring protein FlgI [Bdellovibrionales bacterium]
MAILNKEVTSYDRGVFVAVTLFLFFCFGFVQIAYGARLKDIADVEGVRGNQLFGYGLVIGLNGTGDGIQIPFTVSTLSNLLEREGLNLNTAGQQIQVKNVASVMVTATLPPFSRPGSRLDITISSLGDAKSLQGGTLLMTPLKGADGNTYAVAQGAVTVGGFSVASGGDAAIRNHPTVGQIVRGATVERSIPFDLFQSQRIRIVLRTTDFTTMTRVVERINTQLGRPLAVAVDGASVEIPLVDEYRIDPIGFVSKLEQLDVHTDLPATVVVNEKTGTIVMGENVTLSTVALAHGNLSIAIRSETQVSQPEALSEQGDTAIVTNTDVTVGEEQSGLSIVGGEVTLGELVGALNALGATPRDLISIFSALQQAGALKADIKVM